MKRIAPAVWAMTACAFLTLISVAAYFSQTLAMGIGASLVNGEVALTFFAKHGVSMRYALPIVLLTSTSEIALCCWFSWFFEQHLKRLYYHSENLRSQSFWHYPIVAAYAAAPGGTFIAIGCSFKFDLPTTNAFLAIAGANLLKMICFGIFAVHVGMWAAVGLIAAVSGFWWIIDKFAKHQTPLL